MATIVRIQAVWTGFQGGPGYTHWYGISDGDSGAAAAALAVRMRAFFDGIKGLIPTNVDIKVQRVYQVINDVNGNITSEAQLAADPVLVSGTAAGVYSAASGAVMNWETGHFNANGRRVRGRTYLVPLSSTAMENDGTLSSTAFNALQAAGTAALGGTGSLGVWTRPSPGGSDGTFNIAISALIKDKVAVLTSRRD